MKMTKEDKQMVEAVKCIKKYCKERDHCEGCPFDVAPYCPLGFPSTWYIPEVSENEKR